MTSNRGGPLLPSSACRWLGCFLIGGLVLSGCGDDTTVDDSVFVSLTDAQTADATDASDISDSSPGADADADADAREQVELPEFACSTAGRAFPLEAPARHTASAFSHTNPSAGKTGLAGKTGKLARRGPARGLDPMLGIFDDAKQVDVLVYRRGDSADASPERRTLTVAEARRLAASEDVDFVAHRPPVVPTVDGQRIAVGTEAAQGFELVDDRPTYSGLTGRGVRVVVSDTGIDAAHPDFHLWGDDGEDLGTRVSGQAPIDEQGHGTYVAGLIAGNGTDSAGHKVQDVEGLPYRFRGHAPEVSEIIGVPMSAFFEDLDALISQPGHLFNHSHTFSGGAYIERIAQYDEYMHTGYADGATVHPPRPVVVAAANNGVGSGIEWTRAQGYYSVLTPAKNPICVGSVNANDLHYATASSMGPTLDGRIKPDLVAPGHRDYRPHDGMSVAFEEVRLHAAEGSGVEDLVWRFDNPDESNGWRGRGAFDAEPVDGVLVAHTLSDRSDAFVLDTDNLSGEGFDGDGIEAADYAKLTFKMKLDVEATEDHRWPRFYVVRWDRDGDGDNDSHHYPRYTDDEKQAAWQTITFPLDDKPRGWRDRTHRLVLRPVVYDDRIRTPDMEEGYRGGSGTSLAAPVVSGAVALVLEQFAALHGVDLDAAPPLPSTIKALLVHSADDLAREAGPARDEINPDTEEAVVYHRGPDFATGYGLLDAPAALDLVAAHDAEASPRFREEQIGPGEIHVYRIPVEDGAPLRVTLAWDDAAGDASTHQFDPKLVNDLDVVAVAPDGTGHSPWLLDPLPVSAQSVLTGIDPISSDDVQPARRCASADFWSGDLECVDRRNNVEQIIVDTPERGFWEVRVRGFDVPRGLQRYSLVVTQACE